MARSSRWWPVGVWRQTVKVKRCRLICNADDAATHIHALRISFYVTCKAQIQSKEKNGSVSSINNGRRMIPASFRPDWCVVVVGLLGWARTTRRAALAARSLRARWRRTWPRGRPIRIRSFVVGSLERPSERRQFTVLSLFGSRAWPRPKSIRVFMTSDDGRALP